MCQLLCMSGACLISITDHAYPPPSTPFEKLGSNMCIQKIYPKLWPKVLSKKKNKRTLVRTSIGCTNILSHHYLFHELVKDFAIEKSSSWMEDHFHWIHARSRAIHLAMQSANVVSSCTSRNHCFLLHVESNLLSILSLGIYHLHNFILLHYLTFFILVFCSIDPKFSKMLGLRQLHLKIQ